MHIFDRSGKREGWVDIEVRRRGVSGGWVAWMGGAGVMGVTRLVGAGWLMCKRGVEGW